MSRGLKLGLITAVLIGIVLLVWAASKKHAIPTAPPKATTAEPRPIVKRKAVSRSSKTPAPPDEGPAQLVVVEEIVINQERKGIGASPDIDAALARLPVLEKCVREPLEIIRLPSLDSHIRMHVWILKRFKKEKEARAWLGIARECSPHARMEVTKEYFLE